MLEFLAAAPDAHEAEPTTAQLKPEIERALAWAAERAAAQVKAERELALNRIEQLLSMQTHDNKL